MSQGVPPTEREKQTQALRVLSPLLIGMVITGLFFPADDDPRYFELTAWPLATGLVVSALWAVKVYGTQIASFFRDHF